jgi:threonine/homoserine/homoserine lactone efflux protein
VPLLIFLSEAVLISLSGVMAPGPITAVVVAKGNKSPRAGALVAIGHGLVEVPLMAAVLVGVSRVLDLPYVRSGIGIVGGVFLLTMAAGMLRSLRQDQPGAARFTGSPVAAGVLLSLANPYFFVWWATVGAALIMRSIAFGVWGFVALALSHWLCDFGWCYFLSALSFKGGQFFGRKWQKPVFAVCGILLAVFGARLLLEAARGLLA